MPFSEDLAQRVRTALSHIDSVEEKKMFGGFAFLVNEKMCINVGENRLMFRIAPELHDSVLEREGCQTVIMQNREYRGYIHVNQEGLTAETDFAYWVELALDFNKRAKASTKRNRK